MTTIQIQGAIPPAQYKMAVRVLKAIGLKVVSQNERKPNKLTSEAMKEAKELMKSDSKSFKNVDELLKSLND